MTQTINVHHDFHRSLFSIEMMLNRLVNPEPVLRHSTSQPTQNQQNLIKLRADLELPKFCDSKDVAIAVLEGQGRLILQEEIVYLEPELFVFIPTQTSYRLQLQTDLILLLSRQEPDLTASNSVWVINL